MEVTQPARSLDVCLCVWVCVLVSAHMFFLMCVVVAYSTVRRISQGLSSHTIHDHTAGSSVHRSSLPSIHPCTKTHYRDDWLQCATSPPSTKGSLLYSVCCWRPAYHGHNEKHRCTCTHSHMQAHARLHLKYEPNRFSALLNILIFNTFFSV